MRCLDTTCLIDYVRGDTQAVARVREFLGSGERIAIPAPSVAEVLVGAQFRGGGELAKTLELLDRLEVIPFGVAEADEAGRLGAEAMKRGSPVSGVDLLVAATARHHHGIVVSRDGIFQGLPGLAVESY